MHSAIDVIIPLYKPDENFCLLLQSLQKQTFGIHKLILANTEKAYWEELVAKSNVEQLLQEAPFETLLFHVEKKDFDHGGTRTLAVEKSEAPIFICMTQDACPVDEYLVEKLVAPIVSGEAVVSYARQLPREDCSFLECYTRSFNYPEKSCRKTKADLPRLGIKTYFCSNVCAAYHRKTWEELGGFERHTIFNEDMIYAAGAIKADYAIAYTADACVMHSHNYTGIQQYRRNFDLAVSQALHPEIFAEVPSESEGVRMVLSTAKYLLKAGKPWLIFSLIWQSGWKYLGYACGKHFRKFSPKTIGRITLNPQFWTWYRGIESREKNTKQCKEKAVEEFSQPRGKRSFKEALKQGKALFFQLVKFGIVGVISTLLDYGLMILFKELLGIYYVAASTLSYLISLVFNYFASMKYVFHGKEGRDKKKEFLLFTVLCLLGMGLNQLVLWLIVEQLSVDYRISKLFATAVVMVWNFVTRKIFLEEKA